MIEIDPSLVTTWDVEVCMDQTLGPLINKEPLVDWFSKNVNPLIKCFETPPMRKVVFDDLMNLVTLRTKNKEITITHSINHKGLRVFKIVDLVMVGEKICFEIGMFGMHMFGIHDIFCERSRHLFIQPHADSVIGYVNCPGAVWGMQNFYELMRTHGKIDETVVWLLHPTCRRFCVLPKQDVKDLIICVEGCDSFVGEQDRTLVITFDQFAKEISNLIGTM